MAKYLYYFTAVDPVHGRELWVTDGTAAGTILVKDLVPGTGASVNYPIAVLNGQVVFAASDGVHDGFGNSPPGTFGTELWITGGTPETTRRISDINPGNKPSNPEGVSLVGQTLFFTATDADGDRELWRTDGNTVAFVEDINPTGGSNPGVGAVLGTKTIFAATHATAGRELYVMGPSGGATMVRDLTPTAGASTNPDGFVVFGNKVLFTTNPTNGPSELWSTDGTSGGTIRLLDRPSAPAGGEVFNGKLYFGATVQEGPSTFRNRLFATDGTAAGTTMVSAAVEGPGSFTVYRGMLYFVASDPSRGRELWRTDGAGIVERFADINQGTDSSNPFYLTVMNDILYFTADPVGSGAMLYLTDGTLGLVHNLTPGLRGVQDVAFMGNKLVFEARGDSRGRELWETDGSVAGTKFLYEINPGSGDSGLAAWLVVKSNGDIDGTPGPDKLDGDDDDNVINGFGGDDVIDGRAGADTMNGGDGNDAYAVDNPGDKVVETNADRAAGGTDPVVSGIHFTLPANVENLRLTKAGLTGRGNALDNVFLASAGLQRMIGGDGNDTYNVDDPGDVVTETNANPATGGVDTVISTLGYTLGANLENLTLTRPDLLGGGNALDNVLKGTAGRQTLSGFAGRDTLDGGAGNDVMSGGDGNDTYIVDSVDDIVTEPNADPATGGVDLVLSSVDFTLPENFENLTIVADGKTGRGNALGNSISGAAGAQTLYGGTGNDTLFGEQHDDELSGGDGNDTLDGGAGNDLLLGGRGADTLNGGLNTDTVDYRLDPGGGAVMVDLRTGKSIDPSGAQDTLTNIETIIGTARSDVFFTAAVPLANPLLIGDEGNDTFTVTTNANGVAPGVVTTRMSGGGGNDTFKLGAVTVEAFGGDGIDTLDASTVVFPANPLIFGLNIDAARGLVTWNASTPLQFLARFSGMDALIGSSKFDKIVGGSADETIKAGAGDDMIDGGAGNDVVDGGTGDDAMMDSAGNDRYTDPDGASLSYANSAAAVTLNLVARTATGNGADTFNSFFKPFTGSRFGDDVILSALEERVEGGAGNDTFRGRVEGDVLIGGLGYDRLDMSGYTLGGIRVYDTNLRPGGVLINWETQIQFAAAPAAPVARFDEIEEIIGTAFADEFTIAERDLLSFDQGEPFARVFKGMAGDDTFSGIYRSNTVNGGDGNDTFVLDIAGAAVQTVDLALGRAVRGTHVTKLVSVESVEGSDAADVIIGSAVANVLSGGDGNDTISGGLGDDTIDGGLGVDTLTFERSAAAVTVNLATSSAIGEGADDVTGIENVTGTARADTITGDARNNILKGGAGNDVLAGGLGNDTLDGDLGFDTASFAAAARAVTVNLQTGAAVGEGTDKLIGIENVTGGAYGDRITGSTSNNDLNGGAGNDTLDGDAGLDTLTGGLGRDVFVFDALDAIDVVKDFAPIDDTLFIDNAMFTAALPPGLLPPASLIIGPAPVATAAAQFLYETDTGILRFDGDGPGGVAAVTVLRLLGNPTITAADIRVI